jgi:TonB-dependent starch-binding outer membrane protein SusC
MLLCTWPACAGHRSTLAKMLLVMKLTVVLLTAAFLQVQATGLSQVVTFSGKNVSLEKVFRAVKKQTGYVFFYNAELLQKAKPVDIEAKNVPLEAFLNELFADQPLEYEIRSRSISLSRKVVEEKQNSAPPVSGPVKGRVVNEKGEPVEGVSVTVKGSDIGTSTNANGEFFFNDIEENATLVFTHTSIEKVEQKRNGREELTVGVKVRSSILDEVQVIPYGTTTRRLNPGNTATINSSVIDQQPVDNPILALQGRIPGVTISQANGVPGSAITVRIQGQNSIGRGNNPLYVVDGVPYLSSNLTTFQGAGILGTVEADQEGFSSAGNPLSFINKSDIESIDILKDADATAIYGSRAANGAILITTKKGKAGALKADVRIQRGWGKVGNFIDLMNSQQYLEMRREAKANDEADVLSTDYDLNGLWDTTKYVDWQKQLIGGTANIDLYNASLSGGTDALQYFLGTNFQRETTVFPGDFKSLKGGMHFSLGGSSINRKFRFQFGGMYVLDNTNLPANDLTADIFLPPVAPAPFNDDGSLNWAPNESGATSWGGRRHPMAKLFDLFEHKTSNIISNALMSYEMFPGFSIKSNFGYTNLSSDQFSAALIEATPPERRSNFFRNANFAFNKSKSWIIEPQINYRRKINKAMLEVLIGGSILQQENEGVSLLATGQSSDRLLKNIAAATEIFSTGADISKYKYNSIFGRVNLNWQDKYIINLNARRDGSSRFGSNNYFHNFGSVGGAWIFTDEKLFQHKFKILSFGKLRASFGTTGSDQIGNYQHVDLYDIYQVGNPYQGVTSFRTRGLANPYLQWEETQKLQGGIELGFLNNKLFLSIGYYHNRSSNQLLNYNLPNITGVTGITGNFPAVVQNTGWEISLSAEIIRSRHFKWTSSVNATVPRNKLVAFPGLDSSSYRDQLAIGKSLEEGLEFRTYRFYGVDPLTGTYLVYDRNGKATASPDFLLDRTVFLSSKPVYFGGLQQTLSFNGFSLDFLIQFVKQYYTNYVGGATQAIAGNFQSNRGRVNQPVSQLARWQKPGDITNIQRFSSNNSLNDFPVGDQAIEDVSFLRLKNVELSYDFTNLLQKEKWLRAFKVFVNAQNVLTVTKYAGLDPESFNTATLPPLRVVTVGVQLGF